MSYYTGTVTDYSDLLDKIVEKAIEVGNNWVIIEDERSTVGKNWIILRGESDSGDQSIYIGIRKYFNALTDTYGFILQGFTGYQSGVDFHSQLGAIPNISSNFVPHIPLWNSSMTYWLTINKRRISFVAKVSTVYQAGYLGYILPYGSTGQYPYPLCIGGSARSQVRYDVTGDNHTHFVIPYTSTIRLRDNNGTWLTFDLPSTSGGQINGVSGVYPYTERSSNNDFSLLKETPGSGAPVYPIQPTLVMKASAADNYKGNIFGELDGIFHCGGLNNAAENIITIAGQDYLVVQNIYRTTPGDYWAFRLS